MPINPFKLERYFAQYEFKVKYLLSPSDCESLSMAELLRMASPASQELWQSLELHYTESQGHPLLRSEVSRLYERISPDQVLIAAPEEAIFIAMQTLLNPGDHVVAISPAYQSLHEVARSIGCDVSSWSLEPGKNNEWHLDVKQLETLITARTRLLIINFPHNPTGHMISTADLMTIVALAGEHALTLFSDEMYRLLEYEPYSQLPPVCDVYEKGISLSGLSKSFALPGLRIGWLAAREPGLIDRLVAYKDYTSICSSAPSEILGIIALQNQSAILRRNLEIIRSNLSSAAAFFSTFSRFFARFPPKAGSVAFPAWLGGVPVGQFCQEVLDKKGVMIVPGDLFGFSGNHFRIGLGRRNLPESLEMVAEYLNNYPEA